MKCPSRFIVRVLLSSAGICLPAAADGPADGKNPAVPLPDATEAAARARLLHTVIHGSLEVMHRDFFRKVDSKAIPSASLVDVFKTMSDQWGVTVRWLASEETVMNEDNKAKDDFGTSALVAIKAGKPEFSAIEGGRFRYAGPIPLHNQCLKCHVNGRTSLHERLAALEISMPVQPPATDKP